VIVGKNDVHGPRPHQVEELAAITIDAEAVRQGHRNFAAGLVRMLGGQPYRLLSAWRVPEIALEIGHLCACRLVGFHVLRSKLDAGAEIGVHRAFAIRRHEDHRTRRWRLAFQRLGIESDALGSDVVGIDAAKLVVGDLAEECRAATKACDAGSRVARATARGLGRRAHAAVEQIGPLRIDQVHRTLDDAVPGQERVVALRYDVDDGVADAKNVVLAHESLRAATAM